MSEGWGWLHNSRKWHYFVGKTSLCGKWWAPWIGDDLEQGNDDSSDNCAECKRRLKRRREAQAK